MSVVRATFRKQVSDANYGNETAECTLEVDVEMTGDFDQRLDQVADEGKALLAMCRRRVFDELRSSPSAAVRRALTYFKAEPVDDRASGWAMSNAMAEEQAIRADDDEPEPEDRVPF